MGNKDELSQDEINQLLGDIAELEDSGEPDSPAGPEETAPSMDDDSPRITIYDFLRPEFISQNSLSTIRGSLEKGLSNAAYFLSSALAAEISFSIESVDALTLEEYSRTVPNPCTAVIAQLPSNNPIIFECSAYIAYLFSRLHLGIQHFGGQPENEEKRSLSPEEQELFTLIVKRHIIPELAPSAARARYLSNLSEAAAANSYELVLTVSGRINFSLHNPSYNENTSNHEEKREFSGFVTIVIPRSSLLELYPDQFKEFFSYFRPALMSVAREKNNNYDIWFKRVLEFPLKQVTIQTIIEAFEAGYLTGEPRASGRTQYMPG
jgi:hypothetical protein